MSDPRHTSGRPYIAALLVLLALTAVSFALSRAGLGAAGPPVALAIAAVKVLVVGAVFMHLREALFATRMVGVATILFVGLLCLGVLADVGFR